MALAKNRLKANTLPQCNGTALDFVPFNYKTRPPEPSQRKGATHTHSALSRQDQWRGQCQRDKGLGADVKPSSPGQPRHGVT